MISPTSISSEIRYAPVLTIVQNISKLSGVGIISTPLAPRLCSLVNPTTVIVATHYATGNYAIPSGSEVKFWVDQNRAITGVIDKVFATVKDVTLLKLRAPINDAISYETASVDQVKAGQEFVFTGIKDVTTNPRPAFTKATRASFMSAVSGMAKFRQSSTARMEAGDSGAPDFVMVGDRMLLIGPHAGANLTNWTTSIVSYFI